MTMTEKLHSQYPHQKHGIFQVATQLLVVRNSAGGEKPILMKVRLNYEVRKSEYLSICVLLISFRVFGRSEKIHERFQEYHERSRLSKAILMFEFTLKLFFFS